MRYAGGKTILSKKIIHYILKDRKPDQWYIEPFVGGCNVIDKVDGKRIGNDVNPYIIAMWKAVQEGWIPPKEIDREWYYDIKKNKDKYPPYLVGYAGVGASFGGGWFGSYSYLIKSKESTSVRNAYNAIMKQREKIKDVIFINYDYRNMPLEKNSIIYCDPPYKNARVRYINDSFNHEEFYEWCKQLKKDGHQVYISEYEMPDDFECIYETKSIIRMNNIDQLDGNRVYKTERLFVPK